MKTILILTFLILNGCATIVKSSRQEVAFEGAPEKGVTLVETPDRKIEIVDGEAKRVLLTRSRSDVPVTITCPDGTKQHGTLETGFDWGWGFWGNVFSWQWVGWVVDAFNDKSYHYRDSILLGPSCPEPAKTAAIN